MFIQNVAIGIVRRGGKYLLTKRVNFDEEDREFEPYAWNIPGGGIDPGEKPEDAVCRELMEETGLKISRTIPVKKVFSDTRKNWQGIFLCFLCIPSDPRASIILNEEAAEYGWFTLDEIRKLKTLSNTVKIIEEAEMLSVI